MSAVKLADLLRRNRELGAQLTGSRYRIALLSNVVVHQFKDLLELVLRESGIAAEVVIGDYDTIVQDSERLAGSDAVVIFWEACNLVDGFHGLVAAMSDEEVAAIEQRVSGEIHLVLKFLEATPVVLINSFSSAVFDTNPIGESALRRTCDRLNAVLQSAVRPHQRVVNLDLILGQVGTRAAVDDRQFQSVRAPYSTAFGMAYAEAVAPAFRSATGGSRKVLVLDGDNTLWGGVLGEDTIAGLDVGTDTAAGRCFRDVQQIIQGFRKQGVLLALCTKNNLADIAELFGRHPSMVLRETDFAAIRANWDDKADNLRSLAAELNLGLDSFVFLDDSAFEVGLIASRLPMVKSFQVPANLSEYPRLARQLAAEFFTLSATVEDRDRTAMYQAESRRRAEAATFDSTDAYLASLQLEVALQWDQAANVARAAQLSQKTNQFNLTTRRYTEADIQRMAEDPGYLLATMSVRDRYGDAGITGLVICQQRAGSPTTWVVDTLLLSCRVIGRKVEYALFDETVRRLASLGCEAIEAEYVPTPKNGQLSGLLAAFGMTAVATCPGQHYRLQVADYQPANLGYVRNSSPTPAL